MSGVPPHLCGAVGEAPLGGEYKGEQSVIKDIPDEAKERIIGQPHKDMKTREGTHAFLAHKAVLAAASPYFSAMFDAGMLEAEKKEITIYGVETDILGSLLDFIYSGQLCVTTESVVDVLVAADMLGVHGAVTVCTNLLAEVLTPWNVLGVWELAARIGGCGLLVEQCTAFVEEKFLEVVQEDEFLALPESTLQQLLASEDLRVAEEIQVLSAALRWLDYSPATRRSRITSLLVHIRLPLLSPTRTARLVQDVSDLSLRVALQVLLADFLRKGPGRRVFEGRGRAGDCRPAFACSLLSNSISEPRRKARKMVYAVGGFSRWIGARWSDGRALCAVERFDTFGGHWTADSSLHQARSGLALTTLHGEVYAIGGESDSMIFASVERFDPGRHQWTNVACLHHPRMGLGAVACNGAIYALGGWVGAEIGRTVERFDPDENKWEEVVEMATPRYHFGCCEMGGAIYVVGGLDESGTELASAERFDPLVARWIPLVSMTTKRAYLTLTAAGGRLFAVGGWNESSGALNSVECYDPEIECWISVPPMTVGRASCSAVGFSGRLFIAGGRAPPPHDPEAPAISLNSVEVFEFVIGKRTGGGQEAVCGSWSIGSSLITGRCEAGLVIL
uniref:Intracisternal A particle-promoted polypeptide n=1 Tax=Eptatretus burgeri TaxID=7764 RepID=A0A8C4QME8_EPTBU